MAHQILPQDHQQDYYLPGIHHITAITADAQKNIDFYCGVLGLRLVKLTVNFDDPASYHLYYGDRLGQPGTILTFFAWPGAYRGRIGPPQVTTTSFAVPAGAMAFWQKRLKEKQIDLRTPDDRFGQHVLEFADPDGLRLEIVSSAQAESVAGISSVIEPWPDSPVSAEHAIRGFAGATISVEGYEKTAALLTDVMGFTAIGSEKNRFRYHAAGGDRNARAAMIDLLCLPSARPGSMGAGVVHHIAFRTSDDAAQRAWRQELLRQQFNVSPVMDRIYFHSIYFREPGGVLFEIATDNPGFTIDEPLEQLGGKLRLPPWLEPDRGEIESVVPRVKLPGAKG